MSLVVTLTGSLDEIAHNVAELSQLLNPVEGVRPTAEPDVVVFPSAVPDAPAPLTAVPDVPVNTGASVTTAELDTAGLPWDVRINAKNKGKNVDGTWRAKRNIKNASPGLIEQVQTELRSTTAPISTPVPDAGPATTAAVPGTEQLQDTIALATQIVTHSTSPDTWGRINGIMVAHELPQGVQSLTQFPAKIPAVHMALQQLAQELGVG